MTSLRNGQKRDYFMYAQGFRVKAACTAASSANNYHKMMCYASIHVFMTNKMSISKLQYMKIRLKLIKPQFN